MDFYRQTILFTKGLLYDSKDGYNKASKSFNEEDLNVDLSGMVFLITGANSGIGFSTAKEIAKRGGEVHLVCRNEERAQAAKEQIIQESGNAEKVHYHILELTCIGDVHRFVETFRSSHDQLDVLINNAGGSIAEYKRNEEDGLECTFATNTLGPFALTTGLIPLLKASKNNPRVVTVGSAGMLLQRLNLEYIHKLPQKYDPIMVYAQCKRQLAILTQQWSMEHKEIHFSCMHPGWVDTPAARRGLGEFYEKMKERFRTPEEGADTVLWLAISKAALSHPNGAYFQDRQSVSKHLPLGRTRESENERTKFLQFIVKTSGSLHNR